MNISDNFKAFLLFLTSTAIKVFLSVFLIKLSINDLLNIYESTFLKVLIPCLGIFFFKFFTIKRDCLKIKKHHILLLFLLSILSLIDVFAWMKAILFIPINNAIIFGFLSPILTLFISGILNKEKIVFKKKISILISFVSVILTSNFIIQKFNIGYLYLLLDIFSSVFIVIIIKKLDIFSSYFLLIVRLILIIPFSLVMNDFFIKNNLHILFESNKNLLYFIIPILYLIERLTYIKMYKCGDISFIEPLKYLSIVFSSIFGYLLLDQKLTSNQIICFIGIVIASIIGNINFNSRKTHKTR